MPRLSVIVITKNEAANIRDCLQSVAWADEIIVVDSGSSDNTADIARQFSPHIHLHPDWPGFGPQKNRALRYASGDWVLSLDADERVSAELRAEIQQRITSGDRNGYLIPRLSQFCGKFVKHSGWHPDHVLRLFRRNAGKFSDSLVHEKVLLDGEAGKLNNPLLHFSYLTAADVERKVEHYSSAAAQQMFQAGNKLLMTAYLSSAWAFIRTYIVRLGFMDGAAGWGIACMNARTTYLKYLKLRSWSGQR